MTTRFIPSTSMDRVRANLSARRNTWTIPPLLKYYSDKYVGGLTGSDYDNFQKAIEKGDTKGLLAVLDKCYKKGSHAYVDIMHELVARHERLLDQYGVAEVKNNYNDPVHQLGILDTAIKPGKDAFNARYSAARIAELVPKMTSQQKTSYDFAIATLKYPEATAIMDGLSVQNRPQTASQQRGNVASGGSGSQIPLGLDLQARVYEQDLDQDLDDQDSETEDDFEDQDSGEENEDVEKDETSLTVTEESSNVGIILAVVGVLTVAGIGGYYWYTRKKK